MSEKYLLGATQDNEIVFAEFGITERNDYPEFTASFNCVRPFPASEVDATEYYDQLIDDMDDAWILEQLRRWDCAPSELAEKLAEEAGEVDEVRDCSLYPEQYDIDGEEWHFESGSCGQHDTRGEMAIMTSQNLYHIHALWDAHHLKKVDAAVIAEVDAIKAAFADIDEEEWITDYIRTTF